MDDDQQTRKKSSHEFECTYLSSLSGYKMTWCVREALNPRVDNCFPKKNQNRAIRQNKPFLSSSKNKRELALFKIQVTK